jgi:hypothetical protein
VDKHLSLFAPGKSLQPYLIFAGNTGANLRGVSSVLTHESLARLEKLARDKESSLFVPDKLFSLIDSLGVSSEA